MGNFSPSLLSVCCHVAQLRSGSCFEAVSHSGFTQSMWQDDPPLSVQACAAGSMIMEFSTVMLNSPR